MPSFVGTRSVLRAFKRIEQGCRLNLKMSDDSRARHDATERHPLLFDPFQTKEILQVIKILIRSDECGAEYISGSGNPEVVFAHVSGGHALWEGERGMVALAVCVDIGVGFVNIRIGNRNRVC